MAGAFVMGGKEVITVDLKNISTKKLVEELEKRNGVNMITAEPYEDKKIKVNGPALVLIVVD